jgi:hypothetical protein
VFKHIRGINNIEGSRTQMSKLVPKPEPISSSLVLPSNGAYFANKPARFKNFFKSRKSDTLSLSLTVREWSGRRQEAGNLPQAS